MCLCSAQRGFKWLGLVFNDLVSGLVLAKEFEANKTKVCFGLFSLLNSVFQKDGCEY